MRMLAFLMILSLALAGCSGDEPANDDPTDEPAGDPAGTQTETATTTQTAGPNDPGTSDPEPTANETNTPPAATLAASITNGEAPVEVNFTLDGADSDGDALSWTFDADEDGTLEAEGTELPATVLFEYAVEGVFNATFVVHDGANETTQVVAINVTAAIEETGPTQIVDATWVTGLGTATAPVTYGDCSGPEDGTTIAVFAVDPATWGRPFTASITDDSGGAGIAWWGVIHNSPGCGLDTQNTGTGTAGGSGDVSGTVPDTYDVGFFYAYGGVNLHVHYEAGP